MYLIKPEYPLLFLTINKANPFKEPVNGRFIAGGADTKQSGKGLHDLNSDMLSLLGIDDINRLEKEDVDE